MNPQLHALFADDEPRAARNEVFELLEWVTHRAAAAESLAKRGTATIVLASALIPVLLLASTEWSPFVLGKLVPGVVSACAAAVAGYLQFRRPYAAWAIYSRFQGDLEAQLIRFDAGAKPYHDQSTRESVLADFAATCDAHVHERVATLLADDDRLYRSLGRHDD